MQVYRPLASLRSLENKARLRIFIVVSEIFRKLRKWFKSVFQIFYVFLKFSENLGNPEIPKVIENVCNGLQGLEIGINRLC